MEAVWGARRLCGWAHLVAQAPGGAVLPAVPHLPPQKRAERAHQPPSVRPRGRPQPPAERGSFLGNAHDHTDPPLLSLQAG